MTNSTVRISELTEDDRVQATLRTAILCIREDLSFHYGLNAIRLNAVAETLTAFKLLSKSGNGIPGLRGLGLKEALAFCESYINLSFDERRSGRGILVSTRGLDRTFKHIF